MVECIVGRWLVGPRRSDKKAPSAASATSIWNSRVSEDVGLDIGWKDGRTVRMRLNQAAHQSVRSGNGADEEAGSV